MDRDEDGKRGKGVHKGKDRFSFLGLPEHAASCGGAVLVCELFAGCARLGHAVFEWVSPHISSSSSCCVFFLFFYVRDEWGTQIMVTGVNMN